MHAMTGLSTIASRLAFAGMLVLMFSIFCAKSVRAAELLMFEDRGCPWCERWRKEVGVAYPKTAEGQRAPLRRLELRQARESSLQLAAPVTVYPTFVLVENGREVGRITGYPGADFFWGLLGELLAKLDRGANANNDWRTCGTCGVAVAYLNRTDVDQAPQPAI